MKNTSKIYAMIIAIIMLASGFMIMLSNISFAMEPDPSPGGDYGTNYTLNFGTASWDVNGINVTAASSDFQDLTQGAVEINERTNIELSNFNPNTMKIKVTAPDGFNTELSVNPEKNGNDYETKLENRPQGVAFPNGQTLTFLIEAKEVQVDDIAINAHFTNTHMIAFINETQFMDDAEGILKDSFEGVVLAAGTANPDGTNKFRFQSCYGDLPIEEYTINNVVYKAGDEGVTVNETGEFEIIVPGAEAYTITGVADDNGVAPRTIIWANPDYVPTSAENAEWVKGFTVKHGYAKVVEVYGANDQLLDPRDYIGADSDEYGLNKGFGWVSVFPGTRVVFEFVPEYGYQLTGITINETPLEAVEATNRFEIIIQEGKGNIHFAATFSKIDDIVKAESEKVESGTIELAENSIEAGTVQLTVSDVELDENKLNGFTEEAGTAIIKDIIDIDLYQVFYKGKNDSDDVWLNQIEELNGEAVITLKLGDDVDVKNVVLIHNIHDGDEYETIEIMEYDEEAHTITFKTKSFSNYAIAEKPEKTPEHIVIKDLKSDVLIAFFNYEGHDLDEFEFVAMDFTNLTDEQIVALNITKADYEKGLKKIKENSEEYGGLIVLYNLQLSIPKKDINLTEGPFTIRIPYTDKLKGYENFKLAYVDEESFELKNVIELKLEDGYLVGELEHLSPYALVGKVVDQTAEEAKTNSNPSTGDNIIVFGSIFVLSTLAMAFEVLVIKKSKNYR